MSLNFNQRLAVFEQQSQSLEGFGRGIEREALRVTPDGGLSQNRHPYAFGSALCHSTITTDYAEGLLEFITPVAKDVDQLFAYLNDVHHYAAKNLENNETLWPISMPCFINNEDSVELAQFGSSNVGKMKTAYRQGLKNRYGSMMQVIAGVHYNFSFPDDFWKAWAEANQSPLTGKDAQSAGYMGLVRNYLRFGWVIPYLFGASPALCKSFLQGKKTHFKFKETGSGTLYLPYATSLRMSDLGYTSSAQSSLDICYNSLDNYIGSVRRALTQKDPKFVRLGIKDNDKYTQLNDNVLQIENELYASIRAKRVQKEGETPLQALDSRGIEYVEIRSLDVNPFSEVGITEEQVNFLDLFLTWCAITPSEDISTLQSKHFSENLNTVVTEGRRPDLMLEIDGKEQNIAAWGDWLTGQLKELAVVMDKKSASQRYQNAIAHIAPRFASPELTSSARILKTLKEDHLDNGRLALNLSKSYKEKLIGKNYQVWSDAFFDNEKIISEKKQRKVEESDDLDFDGYLQKYFLNAQKK